MKRLLMFPAAVLFLFASCTQESTGPLARIDRPQAVDPYPGAYGVYLGFSVNSCLASMGATGPDTDQDGLTDLCEQTLADAFAPELRYKSSFYMEREPRWAARPTAASDQKPIRPAGLQAYGPGKVIILYLLSYRIDNGDVTYHIEPHYGDSEVIALVVYYKSNTEHWVLDEAHYSAHYDYGFFSKEFWTGPGSPQYPENLTYPGHPGTYPRAWVATSKHANYSSQALCNEGGTLGFDTCEGADQSLRVQTYLPNGASGNIGSYAVRYADCVQKQFLDAAGVWWPGVAGGRFECFWTDLGFRGWYDSSFGEGTSSPQSWRLNDFGFVPPSPPPPPPECGHWEVVPIYDGDWQETGYYENVWVPEDC